MILKNQAIKEKIIEQFTQQVGYIPNIDNPKSFNEKIQWLKLYYRNPLLTKCADKYTVREYVKEKIGEQYLIPLIGIYDNPDQIDFNKLPNKFVLKTNNGSGKNIICKNKKKLNIEETKSKLTEWLKPENSHYFYSYEWAYKDIKPKIICEEYLESKDGDLKDYKFMCFHGKIENIFVCTDRKNSLKVNFYDLNWKLLPFTRLYPNSNKKISKPKYFKKMVEIAEMLAKDFPFVRVDLYENKNNIYFGELTFYPGNGMEKFQPPEWDYKMGKFLSIKNIVNNQIRDYLQYKKTRKAKVAIYTAYNKNYDKLLNHTHISKNFDYICFTDKNIKNPGIWEIKPINNLKLDAVRTSRYYKLFPHKLLSKYKYSVWIDSNVDITSNTLENRINQLIKKNIKIAIPPHFERNCIYIESIQEKEQIKLDSTNQINSLIQEKKVLQKENTKLKSDLNKIQSSKTYKLWQKYNEIRKIFINNKE